MSSNNEEAPLPVPGVDEIASDQMMSLFNGLKPRTIDEGPEPHASVEPEETIATSNVLRLHGLPYTVTEEQIRNFFKDVELAEVDPILFFTEGLHRGAGYVRLRSTEDVPKAITMLHRQHIDSNRYVELSASTEEERQRSLTEQETSSKIHVLRLRGLPFTSTEDDVREFVKSIEGVARVDICRDVEGRSTGDAFVELTTEGDVEQARLLHNKTLGSRYIEVLSSTVYDRDAIMRAASIRTRRDRRSGRGGANNNMAVGGRGRGAGMMPMLPNGFFDNILAAYMGQIPPVFGNEHQQQQHPGRGAVPYPAGGAAALFPLFPGQTQMMAPRAPSAHVVRIRGVPYTATEESIAEFFSGVKIPPQGVHMVYNEQNRPTGEAFVELEDETDVAAALDKNGEAMGNRYIEVFQSSATAMQRLGNPLAGMIGMMQYPMQGMGMIPPMFY